MSMSLANLVSFFRSHKHKQPEDNELFAIELLKTMQWSKLCWDASWENIIELDTLLPKIGNTYPIKIDDNEYFTEEGKAYILWLPPTQSLMDGGTSDHPKSSILMC